MKKLLLAVGLLVASLGCSAWERNESVEVNPNTVKSIRFDGDSTDIDMLKAVRGIITQAQEPKSQIKVVRIYIASGGGPVITSLEIGRIIRKASDSGLVMEIHAEALCASGCTLVLASGTPGYRFVQESMLFLVHPIQQGSAFGPSVCVDHKDKATTQEEKATNTLLELMRNSYVRYTKQSVATVEKWLVCGNEQVGDGNKAVEMKIADRVEK